MADQNTSSAALSEKDIRWSAILTVISGLVRANMLNPDPDRPGKTREQIFADWTRTAEGGRMLDAWMSASTDPIRKGGALPFDGRIKPISDAILGRAIEHHQRLDSSLSTAQATDRFLRTKDGALFYEAHSRIPPTATFADSAVVKDALGCLYRGIVAQGERLEHDQQIMKAGLKHPFAMEMATLLRLANDAA